MQDKAKKKLLKRKPIKIFIEPIPVVFLFNVFIQMLEFSPLNWWKNQYKSKEENSSKK